MEDKCVICGKVIPEGRHICPICEKDGYRVNLGNVVMTRGINELCKKNVQNAYEIGKCLGRHQRADWGDLDEEDKEANDLSLKDNGRLLSCYYISDECVKIYIITEWDRSHTTILLPEEY